MITDSDLNPRQREAVTSTEGPLLVIAGAGSGKTRTLVHRVAHLVQKGVMPESILLLTFTRRAAEEMIERASRLGDQRCRFVAGGTFHSFAYKVLRQYSKEIGFQNGFTVIDRGDTEDIIGSIISEVKERFKGVRLPKKSTIAEIISKANNLCKPIYHILRDFFPHFLDLNDLIEAVKESYEGYKVTHQIMDYDDLLIRFLALLKDRFDIKSNLSQCYRYIMVDEYQDTNKIQAQIIVYLGQDHRNVMVVGDDSQAIYAFRGANYKNMFEFKNYFPDAKVIKLEENYRSTQHILNFTNAIMEKAVNTYTKCLFTQRKGGILPRLVDTLTELGQAIFVADCIERLLKMGIPPDEIAVLFRAAYHSFELEAELTRRKIPYVKYGGFKFLESAHIKDILGFFRAYLNPEDPMALSRVLMMHKQIGPSRLKKILAWLKEGKRSLSEIGGYSEGKGKAEAIRTELGRLGELFKDLESLNLDPKKAVLRVLDYYTPILTERFDDYPRRQREIEELVPMAERYPDLASFLADLVLDPPNGNLVQEEGIRSVTLSTIHSAKGLEWSYVFIIWVAEGRFPSFRAYKDPEELEEERRLLYVAATRAKEDLILTYPSEDARELNIYGQSYSSGTETLSSFLLGLSEGVVERVRFKKGLPFKIYHPDGERQGPFGEGVHQEKRISSQVEEKGSFEGLLEDPGLKKGDKVRHQAFGVGVVSKGPMDDKVEVLFAQYGKKLLHLKYTRLERL